MAKLFGFSIDDSDKLSPGVVSPVPPNKEDGVDHYLSSGFFGSYVDIEGVYRTEFDLIKRYREMALHPECDSAIEDIVNEAIVSDTNDSPVQIDLDNLNASDGIKKKIRQEFKYILELLDFDKKAHEIYRNWYVDGRLYYHKLIDLKNPELGIQELRYIDAMKMRYVRQAKKKPDDKIRVSNRNVDNPMDYSFPEIEEYFIYEPKMTYPTGTPAPGTLGGSNSGVRMTKDSITYCTSGLVDRNKGSTLSYLHKAIKSLNQLRMIEDSLVIYRLCLVGETRVKTNQGYSYIKDINVGDTVYSYDNRIEKLVETKVTNKWLTGVKQTYKVKSKHHSIVGTDTHPILVYDIKTKDVKYVPIKDLEPKRHCLTYIKPEETTTNESFITFNDNQEIPAELFVSNNDVKLNYIGKVLDSYGIQMDTIDGFSWKISSPDKKFIEDIKEIWTSLGMASSGIDQNDDWSIFLGEYELPKFEKIEKIEIQEVEEVYDIEVEHEKHNFVANGIIVHNSRAPERRIFYIDVGNLPKVKAEQYLRDVMMRYRNKIVYDANTGETKDDRKYMAMLEDFWLPRREGGRGTEISTLPGGQNLGEITDIEYFKKKLYRSLNVPPSRMDGEGGFNLGRSSEILRDEVKFSKFVARLRKRFSYMFSDMLRTQLILKNIITPEDWNEMDEHIQYDFLYDNHFAELKDAELLNERLNMLQVAEPYIGKYYSQDYVRRKILRQTDVEILEQDELIKKEIKKGIIPDPAQQQIDPETGLPMDQTSQMDLGQPVMEPDLQAQAKDAMATGKPVEMPKGGQI